MQSVNLELTASFSTHHHLNPTILAKYRQVDWVFALYRNIELEEVYFVTPGQLELYFNAWEKKWHESGGKDINNPKIPVGFVRKNGRKVYPK